MALALVTLLVLHHVIWWVGLSILKEQPPAMTWESHADNRGYKVILASYCILAVAILLAFVKNLSFFEANSITGPLLQAFHTDDCRCSQVLPVFYFRLSGVCYQPYKPVLAV